MKFEISEPKFFSHEGEDNLFKEKIEQDILKLVERLFRTEEGELGEGSTAKVFEIPGNDRDCYKIIMRTEVMGKKAPKSWIKALNDNPDVKCLPLSEEAEFLEACKSIEDCVKVPTPHLALKCQRFEEGEGYYVRQEIEILAMEKLNAVTLKEVLEENASLPDNFNADVFFEKLKKFFALMHERGIFHRDAHEGNIMVDILSGDPRVIDFGLASRGNDQESYRDESAGGAVTLYIRDEDRLDEVEQRVRAYLTKR